MMNHHLKIGVKKNFFLLKTKKFRFLFLAITFCVIGQACSNTRLLSALDDRYAYECLNNEEQILRTLSETKQLLTKRQLRIYVMESFEENLFYNLKEDENIYIISAELVLTCAEKKIDIPVPRRNRPLYSQHLSSAVICFVGGTRREIHVKKLLINVLFLFYKYLIL
jgi:hypothetical protein